MTEIQQLQLAAKAAGYVVGFAPEMSMTCVDGTYYMHDRGFPAADREGSHWWNPMLDDGDAQRLSVQLRMDTGHGYECAFASVTIVGEEGKPTIHAEANEPYADHGGDAFKAMRRAITSIAVKVGESM